MRKYLIGALSLGILLGLSCGGQTNNGLTVTVVPNQPYIIPGTGTYTFGGVTFTAPLFVMNSVNIAWAGPGTMQLISVTVQSPIPGTTATNGIAFSCTLAGDQMSMAYNAFYNATTGQVMIPATKTAVSAQIPCAGLTLPTPLPATLSVQSQVLVIGIIYDSNNNITGRVQATQNITLQ